MARISRSASGSWQPTFSPPIRTGCPPCSSNRSWASAATRGSIPTGVHFVASSRSTRPTCRSAAKTNQLGSLLLTDGNTAYRRLEDRGHQAINLSAVDAPPAHEVLPWVHLLFANFKRWSHGTYHGVRDKHVDIYANEFVFRWNRRRHFQTNVDTILGLGQRIGRTTWRDIVGDTGEWKEAHEDQVLAMVRPDRLDRAKDYALEHGCDIFEALDEVRRSEKRWKYRRRPPRRSALPPRRSGEERNTRRYVHPPLLDPAKGYLRHIPPGSKITGARHGLQTEAKLARFTA
jgi:hypothetical protein